MLSADELAGVVDLFGALTRAELETAVAELAFKRDGDFDTSAAGSNIEAALRSYHLLVVPTAAVDGKATRTDGDPEWLVPGPAAFPTLPDDAADLPHILDIGDRSVDREVTAHRAEERFRADAAAAVDAGETERIETLRDVSYELEAWGQVDLAEARARLDG